jgi:hypothetical protein
VKTLDLGGRSGAEARSRSTFGRMRGFLIERYWPGVTPADVRVVDDQLVRLSGADATFLASTLMPADEVVFFEFRAVDGAAVLDLARRAGLPCDRLVAAERRVIDP